MKTFAISLCAIALTGCASIVEGTSQEITVNTNPAPATCGLYRQGTKIGEIASTPGSVLIKKTKYDITVLCVKDGYQQATYLNHSGAAGATFGNIVLGGGIGWAIDSASGADNKYDSPVNLTLVPAQQTSSTGAPPPGTQAPSATPLPDSLPSAVPAS
jgi:hypothetical protein